MNKQTYLIQDLQYGDGGKGKLCDMLITNLLKTNDKSNLVCIRYNGGENAGHTVYIDNVKYFCNSIPCGIFNNIDCYIASGCVFNPITFLNEVDRLEKVGMKTNIYVSSLVSVITEEHILRDKKSNGPIGTTNKGIGPCYSDNVARCGIRLGMLMDNSYHNLTDYRFSDEVIEKLRKYVINDNEITNLFLSDKIIILEGANALMLDNKNGTYPYSTSSDCSFGGVFTGLNISPLFLTLRKWEIIMVIKAYMTRVGNGILPTEEKGEIGERLQINGNEFGTTTGRKRRCGWLDLVQLKFAMDKFMPVKTENENIKFYINLTKLDILKMLGKESVKVAVDYEDNKRYPLNGYELENVKPVYTTIDDFENNTDVFINMIEKELNCKIKYLNTGKNRDDIIIFD